VTTAPASTSNRSTSGAKPSTDCCARNAIRGGQPVWNAIQYSHSAAPISEKVITANQSMTEISVRRIVGSASAPSIATEGTSGSRNDSSPRGDSSASSASAASDAAGTASAGSRRRSRQRHSAHAASGHAGQKNHGTVSNA